MTPAQQALKDKHGTPAEFARAVFNAWDMLTPLEQQDAIKKYAQEWRDAGRSDALSVGGLAT